MRIQERPEWNKIPLVEARFSDKFLELLRAYPMELKDMCEHVGANYEVLARYFGGERPMISRMREGGFRLGGFLGLSRNEIIERIPGGEEVVEGERFPNTMEWEEELERLRGEWL